jgi:hypothetical protein
MDVELVYSEERGTWNVFHNGEWYYEGNYEDANEVYESFFWNDDDEYYGDDGDAEIDEYGY